MFHEALGISTGPRCQRTLAAGALVGLRVLFADLFENGSLMARCAFAVWALVALIMGMRLYVEFVA